MILQFAEFIATLAAGLFTGAAIYINRAEHPARMECGTELAATVFEPSYKRASVMQVALALVSTLAGFVSWIINGQLLWLVEAVAIISVIPFTLIFMMSTNKKLIDPDLDRKALMTKELLIRWGKLHAVRSILGLVATLIFLYSSISTN